VWYTHTHTHTHTYTHTHTHTQYRHHGPALRARIAASPPSLSTIHSLLSPLRDQRLVGRCAAGRSVQGEGERRGRGERGFLARELRRQFYIWCDALLMLGVNVVT